MSGSRPVCEDSVGITARVRELRAERMQAIAGCGCPPSDIPDQKTHRPNCPFGPEAAMPSQMQATLEAMARARARLRQAGVPIRERADEIIAEGIAAKYARHRVLS